jgi:hypothetical protein
MRLLFVLCLPEELQVASSDATLSFFGGGEKLLAGQTYSPIHNPAAPPCPPSAPSLCVCLCRWLAMTFWTRCVHVPTMWTVQLKRYDCWP